MELQQNEIQQKSILGKISSQLKKKPTSSKIPFEEYVRLARELYSMRLRVRNNPHQQVPGANFESLLQKVVSLEQSLKFSELTRTQLEYRVKDLELELEGSRKENEKVVADFDYIFKLYQIEHQKNISHDDKIAKVISERDHAELQVIVKTKEILKLQETLDEELGKLKRERRLVEEERVSLANSNKMDIKKSLTMNQGRATPSQQQRDLLTRSLIVDQGKGVFPPTEESTEDFNESIQECHKNRHQSCILSNSMQEGSAKKKTSEDFNTESPFSRQGNRKNTDDFDDDFITIAPGLSTMFSSQIHKSKEKTKSYTILSMSTNLQQSLLATSGNDHRLVVSDLHRDLKQLCAFSTGDSHVTCSTFTESSDLLVTGSANNLVCAYSVKRAVKLANFNSHSAPVKCVGSLGSYKAVTGSEDRTAKIWDLKKNCFEKSILFYSAVLSLATNTTSIITGHYDGHLRMSSLLSKNTIFDENLFDNDPVDFITLSNSQNSCLALSRNRNLKIFDLRTQKVSKSLSLDGLGVFRGPKIMADTDDTFQRLFIGTNGGELKQFNVGGVNLTMESSAKVGFNGSDVPFVIYNDITEKLICADFDGFVHVLEASSQVR
jgi:WD40 repeat protein